MPERETAGRKGWCYWNGTPLRDNPLISINLENEEEREKGVRTPGFTTTTSTTSPVPSSTQRIQYARKLDFFRLLRRNAVSLDSSECLQDSERSVTVSPSSKSPIGVDETRIISESGELETHLSREITWVASNETRHGGGIVEELWDSQKKDDGVKANGVLAREDDGTEQLKLPGSWPQ